MVARKSKRRSDQGDGSPGGSTAPEQVLIDNGSGVEISLDSVNWNLLGEVRERQSHQAELPEAGRKDSRAVVKSVSFNAFQNAVGLSKARIEKKVRSHPQGSARSGSSRPVRRPGRASGSVSRSRAREDRQARGELKGDRPSEGKPTLAQAFGMSDDELPARTTARHNRKQSSLEDRFAGLERSTALHDANRSGTDLQATFSRLRSAGHETPDERDKPGLGESLQRLNNMFRMDGKREG